MKLDKSLFLVLCAVVAIVCGCGTQEPDGGHGTTDIQAEQAGDEEPAEVAAVELEEFTNGIGMKFKLIPAGEFMMGSPEDEEGRNDDEQQHQVRITKRYYLGVTEVTQGQWEVIMGTRPWEEWEKPEKSASAFAAFGVSWEDAVEFCRKLSVEEGRTYRLPTEAEWEYACRAGSTTRYCFGDDDSVFGSYGWHSENTIDVGEGYAHGVGLKRANAWGLHDMHGNVLEFCQDWYDSDCDESLPAEDPTGPSTGSRHPLRGGCWGVNPPFCRSAIRYPTPPGSRFGLNGFRVALD